MVLRGVVVWCGVLAVWLLCSPAQPAHAAASPSYVAMFSDGDWVGGGVQRLFHSGNASISISGTPGYLTVGVAGGTSGDSYGLVTIDGVGLDDATAVTFGGVPALFDSVSTSQLQAIVPYAAAPGPSPSHSDVPTPVRKEI